MMLKQVHEHAAAEIATGRTRPKRECRNTHVKSVLRISSSDAGAGTEEGAHTWAESGGRCVWRACPTWRGCHSHRHSRRGRRRRPRLLGLCCRDATGCLPRWILQRSGSNRTRLEWGMRNTCIA